MSEISKTPAPVSGGLRDVVALSSSICSIENDVLSYRGINIDELAEHGTFEEIIHLLWFAKLPTADELRHLRGQIAVNAVLPSGIIELMKFSRGAPRRWKCVAYRGQCLGHV